jgi:peptide-methionine (S)-S-oxide reductase
VLVEPKPGSNDRRVEVLCAKSKFHLGHYFGPGEGYCINASVLNYFRGGVHHHDDHSDHINGDKDALLFSGMSPPISYRSLEQQQDSSPSVRILNEVLRVAVSEIEIAPAPTSITRRYSKASYVCEVVLGAGCFWHVEAALRRLPGVIDTTVGYAGGGQEPFSPALTYEQVCQGATGHAEVVRVKFHPSILAPRVLLDCFLAMHDPTKVRAHGKHAHGTGQYRSCILLDGAAASPRDEKEEEEETLVGTAHQALTDCRAQLGKELSTELCVLNTPMDDWFFAAEERHQRHDEQKQ